MNNTKEDGTVTAKLRVSGLFKVFGPEPDEAVRLADEGVAKEDIFRRTASVVAVDDISFEVPERNVFVVMGLSGSGKSTLIRCLNRLIEPTQGQIFIDEHEITALDHDGLRRLRLNKMAMVFQHFALFPHRTVVENAEFGLKLRGVDPAERRQKAMSALEAVGLDAWANAWPEGLSGGMRQRVGLARALTVEPEILLMDEPFSALDPLIRNDMQEELLKLQERYKSTIIFITHDLHEALKIGDRIAIMKDGQFVQVGGPEEIINRPADEYVSSFVKDVDRARVLTLGTLMRKVEPVRMDAGEDLEAVRRRLDKAGLDALPVVDSDHRLQGIIGRRMLDDAGKGKTVDALMRREALHGRTDEVIHGWLRPLAEAAANGLTLPVVDGDGKVKGVIEPITILDELGTVATSVGREEAEAGGGQAESADRAKEMQHG